MGHLRSGSRLRIPLLLASFAVIAAYFALQAQAAVLKSAAAPVCAAGSPAAIQGGPGMAASNSDVVEIVTGWYRLTVGSDQVVSEPSECSTVIVVTDGAGGAYDVLSVARAWLWTDSLFFVPAYTALLALVVLWARRQGDAPGPDGAVAPAALPSGAGTALITAAGWLSRKRFMLPLVAVGASADLIENWLIRRRLNVWWSSLGAGKALVAGDLGITALRAVGWAKWLMLLVPLLVAVVCAARQASRAAVSVWRALPGLWFQLLLVMLFIGGVAVPDQSSDAVRRLSPWQWAATLTLLALLVFVLLMTATGALKPRRAAPERAREDAALATAGGSPPPSPGDNDTGDPVPVQTAGAVSIARWPGIVVMAIGALIGFGGVAIGWQGLVVPGVVVAVTGALSFGIDLLARRGRAMRNALDAADAANMSEEPLTPPDRLAAMRRVGTCIAAAPVAAFGVAVIRATAGDAALLGIGDSWERGLRVIIGIVLTIGAGALVVVLPRLVDVVTASTRAVRLGITAALAAVLTAGVVLHDPDVNLTVADEIGALGLLMVFLSGLALLPVAAAWASYCLMSFAPMRPVVLPSAVRVLRIRSTPVLGLLVAWVLLAGFVDYPGYHDVRRLNVEEDVAGRARTIDAVAKDWWARQAPENGSKPALLVAASGGGIRAAYWTAAVLDCVIERNGGEEDPCAGEPSAAVLAGRRSSLLAMSGISGGSLGLAAYVTAIGDQWADSAEPAPLETDWYDDRLGGDYLAPTVAAWLFNDGLNALLRPEQGVDRAAVLERAWESDWVDDELSTPFLTGQLQSQPLLLLNGFSVEDGCRVNNSVLASDRGVDPSACDATGERGGAPSLRSTADLLDVLCADEDVRVSTASLNSARFPYVTPSGRLRQCEAGVVDDGAVPDIEVVDGGYRETSGASTVVELWPRLEAAIVSGKGRRCAAPVFVQIDNGYSAEAVTTSGRDVVSQFTTPILALMASTRGQEHGARQASFELFDPAWFRITTSAHPGSSAPLGWVLSGDARTDLQDQLSRPATARTIVALRAVLDAPISSCE